MSTSLLIITQDTSPISPSVPAVISHWQDGANGNYSRVQWLNKNLSFGRFWQMLSAGPPVCTELKWYQNLKFSFGYTNAIIMKISRSSTVCLYSHLTFPRPISGPLLKSTAGFYLFQCIQGARFWFWSNEQVLDLHSVGFNAAVSPFFCLYCNTNTSASKCVMYPSLLAKKLITNCRAEYHSLFEGKTCRKSNQCPTEKEREEDQGIQRNVCSWTQG